MKPLYFFPAVLLLSKWVLAATLTVTETQTLPSPIPTPDPTTEQDTYVTTTIFAYHETDVVAPQENAQQGEPKSAQTKIRLARPTGFVGGIDLIPVVNPKNAGKSIKKAEDDDIIQVGFDKNYFETHLAEQKKEDGTNVVASSPYHLQPGYRGEESSEEQAKLETTTDVNTESVSTGSTTSSPTSTVDLPTLDTMETATSTTDSLNSVDLMAPTVSPTPTSSPSPSPSPVYEEDKPFTYDELEEITFWGSPKMNDNHIGESELKWERLPEEEILEHLIKQPYMGLGPGEKMPAPPVKKIMTDHLVPPEPTSTASHTSSSSTASSSSSDPTPSKDGSKGKQVRFGDQDGKVSDEDNNETSSSSSTDSPKHTETKALKLIREKLLNLKKKLAKKSKLVKMSGSITTPSRSSSSSSSSSSKGSFSGRKAELRSNRRMKNALKSGSSQVKASVLLCIACFVVSIW